MHKVNYRSRISYVSNCFYCRIGPEGLLCDAERDLLAIAKFLVTFYDSLSPENLTFKASFK